jgi:O-antigen/teichoic acid export membrane protein
LLAVASVAIVRRETGMRLSGLHRGAGGARQMLSYGLPLAATGLAGALGYQFDRIVVSLTYSPRQFAIYALGAVEVPLGLVITFAISNVLVPRLTILWRDGERGAMFALWRESMRKTSLILLPLFAFMMAMSADLIRLLYGPGFSESVDVFRIYLFLLPLRIATWGLIPQAIGRTRVIVWASVLILVANAAVAIALVGPLGLLGPALAAPIASVAAAAYFVVRIRSIAGLNVRELIPVRALAGTMAVSILAAAPLLIIRDLPAPASVRVLIATVVFSVVAPAGLRATRSITDDDWQRVRDVIALRPWRSDRI